MSLSPSRMMAARAEGLGRRGARAEKDHFYPTPAWATKALLAVETFEGAVWECACGAGHMARVLEAAGHRVVATDLVDRGYGTARVDFTMTNALLAPNIVTNPPFKLAGDFVRAALRLRPARLALLLPLAFLEGQARCREIFEQHPPHRVWVFARRPAFKRDCVDETGGGLAAYGWFVWHGQPPDDAPRLGWLRCAT